VTPGVLRYGKYIAISIPQKPDVQTSQNFACTLSATEVQFSIDGVVLYMYYALLDLWMT